MKSESEGTENSKLKNFLRFAPATGLLLMTILIVVYLMQAEQNNDPSRVKEAQQEAGEISPTQRPASAISHEKPALTIEETTIESETAQTSAGNATGEEGTGSIPGSELWFEDPGLRIEGSHAFFAKVPKIVIDWDPTCNKHTFKRFDDLSILVEKGLYIDPKDYFQSRHLALQFTQFWKQAGLFFQFGYAWEQNAPQTFSLEAFSASDKYMSKNVKRINIKELSADGARISGFFASQLQSYLRYKLTDFLASESSQNGAGGSLGARVALIKTSEKISESGSVESFEVSLRNSTVISLTNAQLNCRKSEKVDKSLCTCSRSE